MLWVPSIPDQVNINHTSCTKNVNFNLDFNKSIFNLFHDLLKVPVIHINNFKVQLISINWTICRIFFWLVCLNNQTSRWSLFCRIRFYPISPITCKCVPRYFYKIFLIHNILRFSSLYLLYIISELNAVTKCVNDVLLSLWPGARISGCILWWTGHAHEALIGSR